MARVDRCSGTLQIRFGADTNGYLDDRPGPAPRPPAKRVRTRAPRPFVRGRSYVFGSVNARRCDVSARRCARIIRFCEAVQHGPPDQRKTSDTGAVRTRSHDTPHAGTSHRSCPFRHRAPPPLCAYDHVELTRAGLCQRSGCTARSPARARAAQSLRDRLQWARAQSRRAK